MGNALTINMNQENEIRNTGKKGLEIYKKFIECKLPLCSFRVSINSEDDVLKKVKKSRNIIIYKFSIKDIEHSEKIKNDGFCQ